MLKLGNQVFENRLLLGTAKYPAPAVLKQSIEKSGAQVVTVSLRRHSGKDADGFWDVIRQSQAAILPNTAGCHTVKEAVTTAHMARELFGTHWIKLETVGDEYTLQPDPFALVEAAKILIQDGFEVFPYTTEDLVVAEKLVTYGCKILMPWGSPIGSGQGLANPAALKTMRARYPHLTLIVDAGIGKPSDAAQAMQLGFDAILLNSAVSLSKDPVKMAEAFSLAIRAGRLGFEAGVMPEREFATPSTPVLGTPFWHHHNATQK